MMCGDSSSSCEEILWVANVLYSVANLQRIQCITEILRLFIAIVVRRVFSEAITSNKAQRQCEGTHIEQRQTYHNIMYNHFVYTYDFDHALIMYHSW